ncbi:hypothetical protein ACR9E3_08790 [Actinomycetospora sp. C-140]
MDEPDFVDLSGVVCPDTGVTAREAAVSAIIARDHLGAEASTTASADTTARRLAMIEDVRVLTGVLALELGDGGSTDSGFDPARQARLVHEATMRSDSFALCAALTLVGLDAAAERGSG